VLTEQFNQGNKRANKRKLQVCFGIVAKFKETGFVINKKQNTENTK